MNFKKQKPVHAVDFSFIKNKFQNMLEHRRQLRNAKIARDAHRMFILRSSTLFKISATFTFAIILFASVATSAYAVSGRIFYLNSDATNSNDDRVHLRTYSGYPAVGADTPLSLSFSGGSGSLNGWTKVASSPIKEEYILGSMKNTSIYFTVCLDGTDCTDATKWSSVGSTTPPRYLEIATGNGGNPVFDIAYETLSGDAVIVYREGSDVLYRVWSSSSRFFGSPFSINQPYGAPQNMKLFSDPTSDKIFLVFSTATNELVTYYWNGTTFVNQSSTTNTSQNGSATRCPLDGAGVGYKFDGEWYADGSKFMIACGSGAAVAYNIYTPNATNGTWQTNGAWPTAVSGAIADINHVDLFGNPFNSGVIGLTAMPAGGATTLYSNVWNGTSWGTPKTISGTPFNSVSTSYPAAGAWLTSTKGVVLYSYDSSSSLRGIVVENVSGTWTWSTSALAASSPVPTAPSGASPNRNFQLINNPGDGSVVALISGSNDELNAYVVNASATTRSILSMDELAGGTDPVISSPVNTNQIPFDFDWSKLTVSSLSDQYVSTAGGSKTITGTNFIQNSLVSGANSIEVTVNGVTATVTAVSDTSVTATLPATTTGSKVLKVRNIVTGKYATTTVTYEAPPTVTAISPSPITTAGNINITVTGSNFKVGSTALTLDPSGTPSSFTGTTTGSITFTAPAKSAGSYTVRLYSTNGTASNGIYTDTTLTYQAPPTISALNPSSVGITGGTVTVTGTGFKTGAGAAVLDPSATSTSITATTTTSITFTAPANSAGTHTLRVYGTNGTASNGLYAETTLTYKTYSQSAFRWFANANSTTPGSPTAAVNTATTFSNAGEVVRLRALVDLATGGAAVGEGFKLQMATSASACSAGIGSLTFSDVSSGSGAIRFYDNTSATDGATLVTTANDPTHGAHTVVAQKYVESNTNFTVRSAISAGQDGIWDFALVNNSVVRGTYYCFRIVRSDGTVLDTYSQVPQITLPNAAPELQNVSASQSLTTGTVAISYEARDADTNSGVTAGTVLPTFEYKLANGNSWTAITSGYLGASDLSAKSVGQSSYTSHTATWNAASQLGEQYSTTVYVRVTINDSEATSNTALATTSVFTVDTSKPTVSTKAYDSRTNVISLTSTDNSTLEYRLSNNSNFSADGINGSSGTWTSAGGVSISTTTLSWSAATTTDNHEVIYLGLRDAYGNSTTTSIVAPHTPTGLTITDISNVSKGAYSEYLSWIANTATSTASLQYYEIWRSTDGSNYSLLTTTADTEYTNTLLDSSLTYYYKITAKSTNGSYSDYTSAVSDRPGSGTNAAPTFDETFDSINSTGITFSQITDSASDNWGKVQIQYRAKDADSESLTFTPTFQYNAGSGWVNISNSTLRAADYAAQNVATTTYTTYTAIWDAKIQSGLESVYNTAFRVRVNVNDAGLVNSTSTSESAPGTLDTKKPTVLSTSLLINGGSTVESASSTVTLTIQNIYGDTDSETVYVQFSSDNTNWYGANSTSSLSQVGGLGSGFSRATSTLATLSWNWNLSGATSTIYMRVIDGFGNSRTSYSTDTATVTFNVPPQFNSSYGTNGIILTQISDPASANWGRLRIQYSVRDTDNSTGFVTPSFEYNATGLAWLPITSDYLGATDLNQKIIGTTSYTVHEAMWNADAQLSDAYISNLQIRVTANDGDDASSVATTTASTALDVKVPVRTFSVDSRLDVVNLNATDNNNLEYRISNDQAFSGVEWTSAGGSTASTSPSWVMSADANGFETVYYVVRDSFGNIASSSATAAPAPTGIQIQDTTDLQNNDYRELISWNTATSTATAPFASYHIYRATSTEDVYTEIGSITNIDQNYYLDTNVATGTTYYYKVATKTTNGDYSGFSSSVNDIPDGVGGVDTTLLAIENVTQAEVQATWIKFTWTTTKLASSTISYSTEAAATYGSTATSSSLVTEHALTLTSLEPGTTYVYRINAFDIAGQSATPITGTFTTSEGPRISNVAVELTDANRAIITWNTNIDANSTVVYSTSASNLNTNTSVIQTGNASPVGGGGSVYQHRVTLSSLSSATKYFYYVKSTSNDGLSNIVTDKNGGDYYTFSTTNDQKAPTITGVTNLLVARNSAVVSWVTDEPATTQALYATVSGSSTDSYANQTTLDSALTTYHVVTFSNLSSQTKYYYKVRSADNAGNLGTSAEGSFTTTEEPIAVYITSSGDGLGTGGGSTGTGTGEEADVTAPLISDEEIINVGPFDATVSFSTSEDTVGFIEFGENKKFELTSADSNYSRSHKIKLRGLKLGTEYFVRIKAQDKSGNFSTNEELSFRTKFAAEDLDDLVKLEDTSQIQDKLDNLIESLTPTLVPPFIGDIEVAEVNGSSALIKWKTNVKTYGSVSYASDDKYASGTDKVYSQEVSDTEEKSTSHEIRLLNLLPGTKYHYQLRAYSIPGVTRETADLTFATRLSKLNPEVFELTNKSFKVRWNTDKPTSSFVEYKNTETGQLDVSGSQVKSLGHVVEVKNLAPGKSYEIRAYGYDVNENPTESATQIVRVPRDTSVPLITGLKIDNSFVPGRTDRIQTVVSWRTNEPAYANILYEEGSNSVSAGAELKNSVGQTDALGTSHNIIVPNLKPGTIYRMQVVAIDEFGNKTTSPVRSIITPLQTKSVFDVILKNFEDTFQFLR